MIKTLDDKFTSNVRNMTHYEYGINFVILMNIQAYHDGSSHWEPCSSNNKCYWCSISYGYKQIVEM